MLINQILNLVSVPTFFLYLKFKFRIITMILNLKLICFTDIYFKCHMLGVRIFQSA
jgi:hypothetical protein